MNLSAHQRIAMIIFWFAQVLGAFMALALIIFIGSTLITEMIEKLIDFKEDYMIFVFFLCEVLVAVSFVISWNRKRLGAILVLLFIILILFLWGREDMNIILLHLPLLLSGLLLLLYSYYKEWILKQKP
jgi:hypothetical protein